MGVKRKDDQKIKVSIHGKLPSSSPVRLYCPLSLLPMDQDVEFSATSQDSPFQPMYCYVSHYDDQGLL